ncbi:MAG: disulfide bond formation protein B [Patescibacteria group bacterium]|jgi:disulfide bond formation protein DsbB
MISTIIDFLAILTIVGDALIVIALVFFAGMRNQRMRGVVVRVGKHGIAFACIVAVIATVGSLFLSEIAHFTPCRLCWFQRILMYPQIVVLGVALWKKERRISVMNAAILSIIGLGFAKYHYYLQMFSDSVKPCSTFDPVSCTEKVIVHFGYITIPMMALTAFALILLFLTSVYVADKKNQTESVGK